MPDPDPAARVAPQAETPGGGLGPHALQILATEHWSLLSARSLGYTEAMNRASIFIAALSGAVVALALVAQATDFGRGFVAFALVLLPVVFFLGLTTVARLAQVNAEDATWVKGMNRIRHAYLDLAPELEPYFVTSRYDDAAGILESALATRGPVPRMQPFVALPGVIALLDAIVAGAVAGIAALGLDFGVGGSLTVGALAFLGTIGGFAVWAKALIARLQDVDVRFPRPAETGRPGG
jgi:hypothetical protein